MCSDSVRQMASLLDETEANVKLIEIHGHAFAAPILNEWRYVTRHVVTGLASGDGTDDFDKAVDHLRRARFDSYDILMLCQIDRIHELRRQYGYFSSCVARYVKDYSAWQVRINAAIRLHRSFESDPNREAYYGRLRETVRELDEYICLLESSAPEWMNDIRALTFENRLKVAKIIGGFLVGAATIIGLFMR